MDGDEHELRQNNLFPEDRPNERRRTWSALVHTKKKPKHRRRIYRYRPEQKRLELTCGENTPPQNPSAQSLPLEHTTSLRHPLYQSIIESWNFSLDDKLNLLKEAVQKCVQVVVGAATAIVAVKKERLGSQRNTLKQSCQ